MIPTFLKVIGYDFGLLQFADFEFIHYDLEVLHVAHILDQLVELLGLCRRKLVAAQQTLQQLLHRVPLSVSRRLVQCGLHIHIGRKSPGESAKLAAPVLEIDGCSAVRCECV